MNGCTVMATLPRNEVLELQKEMEWKNAGFLYSEATVLTRLQEVANFSGANIDWERLVKTSSTGISDAREYQMLWRHLAYRGALLDGLEDDAKPLDDDCDLEFDLEVTPAVSHETSAEVAACVKMNM
ncbi:hypothetical protein SAY86_022699 [Trapa natans]|uniref:Uncharacterized protein n=1 Tax=Trapa natans TaxID=22666 RepID=A0AAN7LUR1_TRANT|nr:hypothetical protein SAY86_022699 [Trapa natans]